MQNPHANRNEKLGIRTLVVVFVHGTHMWPAIQPEAGDQALCDDLFHDTFGQVWGEAMVESVQLDTPNPNSRSLELRIDLAIENDNPEFETFVSTLLLRNMVAFLHFL